AGHGRPRRPLYTKGLPLASGGCQALATRSPSYFGCLFAFCPPHGLSEDDNSPYSVCRAAPSGPACSQPPVKPMGSPAGAPHRTGTRARWGAPRSEEHTSELQSLTNLVCRLLLEKKKHKQRTTLHPTE